MVAKPSYAKGLLSTCGKICRGAQILGKATGAALQMVLEVGDDSTEGVVAPCAIVIRQVQ